MAFVGAFGTGSLPFLPRLAYWLILMETGAAIGIGVSTGLRAWGRLAARPLFEGGVISLLIALPLTLVATGLTVLFFDLRAPGIGALTGMFLAVLAVTAAVTAINYATATRQAPVVDHAVADLNVAQSPGVLTEAPTAAGDAASPVRPRLLDRLPPHLRADDIVALQSEDHYLRVHVGGGSHLILLRMADALAELEGVAGARTHRSWWVARHAVASAARLDGRAELRLVNGMTAPVSRSALSDLEREGWLRARR